MYFFFYEFWHTISFTELVYFAKVNELVCTALFRAFLSPLRLLRESSGLHRLSDHGHRSWLLCGSLMPTEIWSILFLYRLVSGK